MANFKIRTSKPGAGNKNFITRASGGWNTCIKGSPTDKECDVLANCVGYASGRFNEIYNEIKGTTGCKYTTLNCNAENFIERAINAGLKTGSTPKPGAIMCWAKGKAGVSSDGAGHVAIVEKVNNSNSVYTSESGYGGSAFWNSTRTNSNGRWGLGSSYSFRAFIYNPVVNDEPVIPITPTVERDVYKDQLETKEIMNVRTGAGTGNGSLGTVAVGSIYNRFESKEADGYTWYRIADGQWIAQNSEATYLTIYNAEPKPAPVRKYKVGDVKSFTGVLYADAQGNGAGQSREGLKATIGIVCEDECSKPYNINNGLGWVAEEDLSEWVEPTPKKEFEVGDKVIATGRLYSSSYAEGPGKSVKDFHTTVALKSDLSRKAPYNIYGTKGQYLGWVTKESLKAE